MTSWLALFTLHVDQCLRLMSNEDSVHAEVNTVSMALIKGVGMSGNNHKKALPELCKQY